MKDEEEEGGEYFWLCSDKDGFIFASDVEPMKFNGMWAVSDGGAGFWVPQGNLLPLPPMTKIRVRR